MSDLFINTGCGADTCADLAILSGDIVRGNDLSTAIAMSLFTDARARASDNLGAGADPRGWWGFALDGETFGSLLWLLENENATPTTLKRAKQYASDALQWLVADGVVSKIDVTTDYQGCCGNVLAIGVKVCKPNGQNIRWRWRYAWDLSQLVTCEYQAQTC